MIVTTYHETVFFFMITTSFSADLAPTPLPEIARSASHIAQKDVLK